MSPKLKKEAASLHNKFINSCLERLEVTLEVAPSDKPESEAVHEGCEVEVNKTC